MPVGIAAALDVTMDDFEGELFGRWDGTFPDYLPGLPLRYSDIFLGPGIQRDVTRNGKKVARARPLPACDPARRPLSGLPGLPPVEEPGHEVPVTSATPGGTTKLTVNERKETTPFNFTPIGEFTFNAGNGGMVEITNGNTDGQVAMDGVRWVWLGE